MIRLLLFALGLGDLAGFVHYLAHHRHGLTGAVVAVVAWIAHRTHLTDIPLFSTDEGRHRPSSRKVRRALKRDRRQARRLARTAVPA